MLAEDLLVFLRFLGFAFQLGDALFLLFNRSLPFLGEGLPLPTRFEVFGFFVFGGLLPLTLKFGLLPLETVANDAIHFGLGKLGFRRRVWRGFVGWGVGICRRFSGTAVSRAAPGAVVRCVQKWVESVHE